MSESESFDYIVVGAGAAGCVIAARLSESGSHSVLLLHSGTSRISLWSHIPLGYAKLVSAPAHDWMFRCEPEPGLAHRSLSQSEGRGLGGGSAINGLIYIRGDRRDYDEWQALGNPGWGHEEVLSVFRTIENYQGRASTTLRGKAGPMGVSDQPESYPLDEAFVAAAVQTGAARNEDFNGATLEGAGYYQINTVNGRRCSTATAYLRPARDRKNLRLLTHSHATRVLLRNGKAVGIEYLRGGSKCTARAKREVIVAAGTYHSPQLLQLSGLGPEELLKQHGVPLVHALPGVGENLQNHYNLTLAFRTKHGGSLNEDVRSLAGRAWMGLRYSVRRSGPLATNATHVGVHFRSHQSLDRPDVKLSLSLFSRRGSDRAHLTQDLHAFSGVSTQVHHLRPDFRGQVRIRSADPDLHPAIRLNFSATPAFRRAMFAGVQRLRRMMASPALARYCPEELEPSRNCASEEQVIDLFRAIGIPTYHPVGTCRMGDDADAVVDHRLKVHGVDGLRVIDASIMPTLVSANTHATTIMIAERGARFILEDAARADGSRLNSTPAVAPV